MKLRLFLSITALLFAFGILGISLFTTPRTILANGESATKAKFYLNQEILPDHVLYPALMAVDRLQLEASSDTERVYMQIEYANRRLAAGQALMDKKNTALAVTTITKAEKYLQEAANAAQNAPSNHTLRQRVIDSIMYHNQQIKDLSSQLTDSDRSVLDKIIEENTVISQSL